MRANSLSNTATYQFVAVSERLWRTCELLALLLLLFIVRPEQVVPRRVLATSIDSTHYEHQAHKHNSVLAMT